MATQTRVSLTSSEVGNGDANDSNTMLNQDGGLAVRIQSEDRDGNPFGPVVRSQDEGVTFGPAPNIRYDVRDLVSGLRYGDQFTHVVLGTQGDDTIPPPSPTDATGPTYLNLGQGDDIASGTSFDDVLIGGVGNDLIDGGAGFDTAIFTSRFADIRFVQGGDTTIFRGAEGTDTLRNIEQFEFSDITIGFRPDLYSTLQTGIDSYGVQVAALYDGILGREVDASGLGFFTNLLDSGVTLGSVAHALLRSGEYQSRYGIFDGGSDESFVTQLYQVALGRTPDQGGLEAYVDALANGVSRAEIASSVALSEENFAGLTVDETGILVPDADTATVARLYFGLLDRPPDAGGLQNFTSFLQSGATLRQAAEAILQSEEGQTRFAGQTGLGVSVEIYENLFGTDIGPRAFAGLLTADRNGSTPADTAAEFVNTADVQTRFAEVIEQGWIVI